MNTVPVKDYKDDFFDYLNRNNIKLENFKKAIADFRKERGLLDDNAWFEYQRKQLNDSNS